MDFAQQIAQVFTARENCERSGNATWLAVWNERLDAIEKVLPSGSGFDAGTKVIHADHSCVKLSTSFHHMNEAGFYDGWTEHVVTIRPSMFLGYSVTVSGRNKNGIKDYIADYFGGVASEKAIDLEHITPTTFNTKH